MVQERLFFWLVEEIDKNWIRLVFVGGFDILHSSEHSSEHKRYVTLRRRTRSGDNEVFGLSSATELNGKAGLINGYDDERQRYIVNFEKFGQTYGTGDAVTCCIDLDRRAILSPARADSQIGPVDAVGLWVLGQ